MIIQKTDFEEGKDSSANYQADRTYKFPIQETPDEVLDRRLCFWDLELLRKLKERDEYRKAEESSDERS